MVIKKIYDEYFQKSKTFLYPLIGISSKANIKPIGTYLFYENISVQDRKLIVVYKNCSADGFRAFEKQVLFRNPMFSEFIELGGDEIAYLFTFEECTRDWDAFILGRYSQMTPLAKNKLKHFYGDGTANWGYIESYLYPDKYIDQYANLLADEKDLPEMIAILEKVGELCDPYNAVQETLVMEQEPIT